MRKNHITILKDGEPFIELLLQPFIELLLPTKHHSMTHADKESELDNLCRKTLYRLYDGESRFTYRTEETIDMPKPTVKERREEAGDPHASGEHELQEPTSLVEDPHARNGFWFDYFGVKDMREVAETTKFSKMISKLEDVKGYKMAGSSFYVFSVDTMWTFNKKNPTLCAAVGTIHPYP